MNRGHRTPKLRVDRKDPLGLEIQAVLEHDLANGAKLMLPRYRRDAIENGWLDGYCAVAAAAYFFLGGGKAAGLQPMQLTHRKNSHWWILKDDRVVIDLTLRPREKAESYPYKRGNPRGFMMHGYKWPSERAAQLIKRVKRKRKIS